MTTPSQTLRWAEMLAHPAHPATHVSTSRPPETLRAREVAMLALLRVRGFAIRERSTEIADRTWICAAARNCRFGSQEEGDDGC